MDEPVDRGPLSQCIDTLASADPIEAERAEERLAAAGADALPLLVRALENQAERTRLRALSLLALLADRSAVRAVAAQLHDPSAQVRRRAALVLARSPGATSVTALTRLLARERELLVRVAAVRALTGLIQTGQDEALRPVFDRLSDVDEHPRVRRAALMALAWLPLSPTDQSARDALLRRLASGPDREVAGRARRMLASPPRGRLESWAVDRLLADLEADRLAVWRPAVTLLSRGGGAIVEPVMQAVLAHATDREYARRCTLVLKALSSRQLARLGPYLDRVDDPIPLEALVVVSATAGSRALQARLAALIDRLARQPADEAHDRIRQLAHQALASAGCRLAIEDLCRVLEDRRIALRRELADAVAPIATRHELQPLLRAYLRSRGVTRLTVRETLQTVVRREKIRLTDRAVTALEPTEHRALVETTGLSRGGNHRQNGLPRRGDRTQDPLFN